MLNENSLMADIALEAKGVSDDVRQVEIAIEASVKHVDNSVVNIDLGGVSEFVDNYPIPKPEVAEGFIGYAVDSSKNEYDVTNIYEKQTYPPAQEEFFQYNGLVSMTETWPDIEMFENAITVQRSANTLLFAGPDGKVVKRVVLDVTSNRTFMFHGYDLGYEDLYMCSEDLSQVDSGFSIYCYGNQGELVKTIALKSKHYLYHGFAFDGEHFYSISRHSSSSGIYYIDKYNSDGSYIKSIGLPASNTTKIAITGNYVVCFGSSSNAKQYVYDKELVVAFDLPSLTSGSGYRQFVTLCGLDCMYILYSSYVTFIDLANKTSRIVQSGTNKTFISYFGSYCLINVDLNFYKFDHKGVKFNIVKPISPTAFTGLASNGSSVMGVRGSDGYSYTDLATKELACLAKKRG